MTAALGQIVPKLSLELLSGRSDPKLTPSEIELASNFTRRQIRKEAFSDVDILRVFEQDKRIGEIGGIGWEPNMMTAIADEVIEWIGDSLHKRMAFREKSVLSMASDEDDGPDSLS